MNLVDRIVLLLRGCIQALNPRRILIEQHQDLITDIRFLIAQEGAAAAYARSAIRKAFIPPIVVVAIVAGFYLWLVLGSPLPACGARAMLTLSHDGGCRDRALLLLSVGMGLSAFTLFLYSATLEGYISGGVMPVQYGTLGEAVVVDNRIDPLGRSLFKHQLVLRVPYRGGARDIRFHIRGNMTFWSLEWKLLRGDSIPIALHPTLDRHVVLMPGQERHALDPERKRLVTAFGANTLSYLANRNRMSVADLMEVTRRLPPHPGPV